MATSQDFETISVIQDARRSAKENGKNIPTELAGGKEYYRKAINSIYLSGWWTVWTAAFAMIISLARSIAEVIQLSQIYTLDYAYLTGYFMGILIVTLAPLLLGLKIRKLNSTPTATLVFLIITLILNLLLSVGILPIISAIMNIIALAHWSTYKDWFKNIDVRKSK